MTGKVSFSNGPTSFTFLADGTGGLTLDGDLYNLELSFFDHLIGISGILVGRQDTDNILPGSVSLLSAHPLADWLSYKFEAGAQSKKFAGLFILEGLYRSDRFSANLSPQVRYYDRGYLNGTTVMRGYVDYDQKDLAATNATNILVGGDDVFVYSARLDLEYRLSDLTNLYCKNEVGRFDYRMGQTQEFYFYTLGSGLYPIKNRSDEINIYITNKYFISQATYKTDTVSYNYFLTPKGYQGTNPKMFDKYFLGAVEITVKF